MKNLFKKVAFVLALAMVLTNMGPAFSASAAETPSLRYASKVLYVGGSHFSQYEESCWTPSQNVDGYTVTYEVTTGKDLITVAKNGKITATGDGIGKAVVKVTYTPDEGGAVITKDFTVKVRRNAAAVRLTNAVIKEVGKPLAVGDEIELIAAKTFDGSYAKGHYGLDNYMKVVSDQITYEVSDPDVIKVEDGKLVAVGAGTGILSVIAYEYGDETKSPVCVKDYDIIVVGGMQDVKQVAANKVEVNMGQPAEGLTVADFTITRVESKLNIAIKSIAIDGNKVTLTTFAEMKDGAEYSVVNGDDEKVFTATDGVVAGININTTQIAYQTETDISLDLVDISGIVIKTVAYGDTDTSYPGLTFTIDTVKGYTSGSKLYLFEIGDTATAKATYVTGKYDTETGAPIGTIEVEFTITAVDQAAVTTGTILYTLTGNTDAVNWSDFTKNDNVAVNDNVFVQLYQKDSNDVDVTKSKFDTGALTLESSNPDVMIVGSLQKSGGNGLYADVVLLKAGTAHILVKDGDTVVATLPVYIKAVREYSYFTLDATNFTLSNSAHIDETKTVKVTFFDQYNEKLGENILNSNYEFEITALSTSPDPVSNPVIVTGSHQGAIAIDPAGKDAGTYVYKVTKGNVSRTITVVVKAPTGTVSYKLETSTSSLDMAISEAAHATKNVEVRLVKYLGGIKDSYIALDSSIFELTKSGTPVNVDFVSGTAIFHAVTATTVSGDTIAVKAGTGSYVATVTYDTKDYKTGFAVVDSQAGLTFVVDKVSVNSTNLDAFLKDAMTFYYDGAEKADADVRIVKVYTSYPVSDELNGTDTVPAGANRTVYISKITVEYKIDGVYVPFTINVGRSFTVN